VFDTNASKELLQFYRASGGEWKVYNITAALDGLFVEGTPTPIVTPSNKELLVFDTDTSKELVQFYRTSGGEWKVYNITAALDGVFFEGIATPIFMSS
jgi:hypothetical protein